MISGRERVLFALLVIFACGTPVCSEGTDAPDDTIADLVTFRQDPFFCIRGDVDARLIPEDTQLDMQRRYDLAYFYPWRQTRPKHGIESVLWGFGAYEKKKIFGENRRPRASGWFEKQRGNSNESSFGTENRRAIAVCEADLRVFPTSDPLFYDFGIPGEGYPFDYVQNSSVKPGEPLFVSHRSSDGAWAFVDTPNAYGWIDIRRIALMTSADVGMFMVSRRAIVLTDGLPLTGEDGAYLGRGKTGTQLPLLGTDLLRGRLRVRVPLRHHDGTLRIGSAGLPMSDAVCAPLPLTQWNGAVVAAAFLAEPYGWGGLNGRRDCSALVMDFFIPFGIWMPRNSREQAGSGRRIDLAGKSFEEKERTLAEEGIPFRTLVAMPGHIMLYIGEQHGRPLVLHNMWGVRTIERGRSGRRIVGKSVITTLAPGMELPERDGLLSDRITGLTLVGEPSPGD